MTAPIPVTCWVVVSDSTGAIVGDGPVRQIVSWSSTSQLSKAGSFTLTVSAADPRASLLVSKRIVRCYTLFRGVVTEIGSGIIDQVSWQDAETLVCTGADLLVELTYRSVRNLKIYTETLHTPVKVWWYDGANWNDLPDCYDGLYTSADSFTLSNTNSFLYIGHTAPFNTLYSHQGIGGWNSVAAELNYGYSDGAGNWPELDVVSDTQLVDRVPWPGSLAGNDPPNDGTGTVLFQRNANWGEETVNGVAAYWIRIDPSESLNLVTIEEFVIGTRHRATDDLNPIMAYAPSPAWDDWDDDADGVTIFDRTTDGTYAVFAGETVLSALAKVAARSGENFRLGANRTLHWLRSYADSGVRAVMVTGSDRQDNNTLSCQIVTIEQVLETNELLTRIYPYGAGNGQARVSLVNANTTMPAGYTLDQTNNYIENTTATALYGRIERVVQFKDVRSTDDMTYDTVEVCNELAELALKHVQRYSAVHEFYRLEVAGLHELLQVGTTLRVIYHPVRNGAIMRDIDADLLILGVTHTFAAGKLFTASLDVGTIDAWPTSDEETVADTVEEGVIYESHDQPINAAMVRGLKTTVRSTVVAGATDADTLDGYQASDFILKSLVTVKGDLIIASAASTPARYALSVPGATVLNVLAVANGEDTPTWKALFDATNPAAIGTATPGTSLLAAHRDHVHSLNVYPYVAGTTNQVTVTDDGDGTITLSLPQAIHTGASPTFTALYAATIYGGTGSGGNIVIHSTSNGTKGLVDLRGNVKITNKDNAAAITFAGTGGAGSTITASGALIVVLASSAGFYVYSSGSLTWLVAYDTQGVVINESGDAACDFRVESDSEANMIFVDASADKTYIAGTTNGMEVAKGSKPVLNGTARYERHIQIPVTHVGNPSNMPTPIDFYTAGGDQYATTGAKYSFCQWEIPDDWDGGNIYFEVDWFPDSGATSGTDAVRWTVEYRAIAEGELINNGTSVTLDNGTGGDTGDYSQYQTKHSRMTMTYNNANQPLTKQDHLYFKVSRDTGVANDFGGSVTVTAYEIIYTSTGFPTN